MIIIYQTTRRHNPKYHRVNHKVVKTSNLSPTSWCLAQISPVIRPAFYSEARLKSTNKPEASSIAMLNEHVI